MENPIYNDYSTWLRQHFDSKVQKISVDAGFTCPNRDGHVSHGGCTFCDNQTFNPSYCNRHRTITEQIEAGKEFFARKYPEMKYIAYFQAYSNTYAPLHVLKERYEEALSVPDVVGIIIGTRPDCIDDEILDYIAELSKRTFVIIEYGVESVYNDTLARINRGHSIEQSIDAIERTHRRGILCGIHVILGLPGESRERIIRSAQIISSMPIDILKIHQLQVIRGTRLAEEQDLHIFELDEYIEILAEYIEHLRSAIVLERFVSQSPPQLLIAPHWGIKNHEFTHKLLKYMTENNMRQGSKT